jgi:hypothetical protein
MLTVDDFRFPWTIPWVVNDQDAFLPQKLGQLTNLPCINGNLVATRMKRRGDFTDKQLGPTGANQGMLCEKNPQTIGSEDG